MATFAPPAGVGSTHLMIRPTTSTARLGRFSRRFSTAGSTPLDAPMRSTARPRTHHYGDGRAVRDSLRPQAARSESDAEAAYRTASSGREQDLERIARVCPQLERLTIQTTYVRSLASLESVPLVQLSLVRSPVPMVSLIVLFGSLADNTSTLARSLKRFSYYCPKRQLKAAALDAALAMLDTNCLLTSVTLGVQGAIYDAYDARLDASTRPEIPRKLAFLSVVRREPFRPIGLLDSNCLSHVFAFLLPDRRIQTFADER